MAWRIARPVIPTRSASSPDDGAVDGALRLVLTQRCGGDHETTLTQLRPYVQTGNGEYFGKPLA